MADAVDAVVVGGVTYVEHSGGGGVTVILDGEEVVFTSSNGIVWFEPGKVLIDALEPLRAYSRNHCNGPVRISKAPESVGATSMGLISPVGTGPLLRFDTAGEYIINTDAFVCASSKCVVNCETFLGTLWNRISVTSLPVCDYFQVAIPDDGSTMWLQTGGPIFKRHLGAGETLQLRMEYLVAFEKTLGQGQVDGGIGYHPCAWAEVGLVKVPWGSCYRFKGPGIVIFSTGGGAIDRDITRVSPGHRSSRTGILGSIFTTVFLITLLSILGVELADMYDGDAAAGARAGMEEEL